MASASIVQAASPSLIQRIKSSLPDRIPPQRLSLAPSKLQQAPHRRLTLTRASAEPQRPSLVDELDQGGPASRALALASVTVAAALFLFTRFAGAAPDLSVLAAGSVPYDQAMSSSRPTMVEFYADWCEVCKEMARDVRRVEDRFKDKVDFVMINVDNPRFAEELDEFGVDGIPHFVFLDKDKNEQGYVVGRLPRRILSENLTALANGADTIPHSQVIGSFSDSADANAPVVPGSTTFSEFSLEAPDLVDDYYEASPPPDVSPTMALASSSTELTAVSESPSLYSFQVEDIKGERVSLEQYRGKVTLVVNVASKCGLTDSNYKGLTQLYSKYKEQGLEILAFPCNQFLGQEPGSNKDIEQFACSRYKATYPLFSKVEVNGPGTAPVYRYLRDQVGDGAPISWNFEKFLVDKEGKVVGRYAPTVSPLSLQEDIEALL